MLATVLAFACLTYPNHGQNDLAEEYKRHQTGWHSSFGREESRSNLQYERRSNPSAALGMLLLASNPAVGYQNLGTVHNLKHAGSRSGSPLLTKKQTELAAFFEENYDDSDPIEELISNELRREFEEKGYIDDSPEDALATAERLAKASRDTTIADATMLAPFYSSASSKSTSRRASKKRGKASSDARALKRGGKASSDAKIEPASPDAKIEPVKSDAKTEPWPILLEPLADLQVDMEIEGKVSRVEPYGVYVDIGPRMTAFLPGSDISIGSRPIEKGDMLKSRIKSIDFEERWVTLSREDPAEAARPTPLERLEVDMEVKGKVEYVHPIGAFVDIGAVESALVYRSDISEKSASIEKGDTIKGRIKKIELEKRIIELTFEEQDCPDDWMQMIPDA